MNLIDEEGKTSLPRWFNGISIILKNMSHGSLKLILPDKRSFVFQGKVKGTDGEALEVFLTHKRQIVIFQI